MTCTRSSSVGSRLSYLGAGQRAGRAVPLSFARLLCAVTCAIRQPKQDFSRTPCASLIGTALASHSCGTRLIDTQRPKRGVEQKSVRHLCYVHEAISPPLLLLLQHLRTGSGHTHRREWRGIRRLRGRRGRALWPGSRRGWLRCRLRFVAPARPQEIIWGKKRKTHHDMNKTTRKFPCMSASASEHKGSIRTKRLNDKIYGT